VTESIESTSRAVEGLAPDRLRVPRPSDAEPAGTQPPGPPDTPAEVDDPSVMSLVDHLAELRRRIFICVAVIAVGGIVGFWQAPNIVTLLVQPLPNQKVQFITLSGGFLLYFKIAVVAGVVIGLPVILYQLWAFIAPGLTERERKGILPWIPFSVIFFLLGLGVAYVTLPYAISFLAGFQIPGTAELLPTGEAYFGFVTMIFLIFGTVMEFPIVLVVLNRLGIVNRDRLRESRRYVLLGIVIFAVVITPGGDPISPTVMSLVMYLLFEFTIFWLGRGGPAHAEP